MKLSDLKIKKRKNLAYEERQTSSENDYNSSSYRDSFIQTGLTNLKANDKMKSEKDILTLDNDGVVTKIKESKLRKKTTPQKGFDLRNLNVGYYILVPMIGGILIGSLLDNQFKSKPLFIGIFLFLGTIAGFYNLIKLLKE